MGKKPMAVRKKRLVVRDDSTFHLPPVTRRQRIIAWTIILLAAFGPPLLLG